MATPLAVAVDAAGAWCVGLDAAGRWRFATLVAEDLAAGREVALPAELAALVRAFGPRACPSGSRFLAWPWPRW